jgi:hypothetical protein
MGCDRDTAAIHITIYAMPLGVITEQIKSLENKLKVDIQKSHALTGTFLRMVGVQNSFKILFDICSLILDHSSRTCGSSF